MTIYIYIYIYDDDDDIKINFKFFNKINSQQYSSKNNKDRFEFFTFGLNQWND